MSGFSVNGNDLSTIFKARVTSPGPTTNFKDSNGNDLNQRFQVSNTPGTLCEDQISYDTSYITMYNSLPRDLRYIFQNINAGPVYFSPAANFALVQSGSSYTLSCKNGDANSGNIVIFNLPISNVVVTLVGGGGAGGASSPDTTNGGGGGGGGNIGQYTLSVAQSNVFSNLTIGQGGTSPGGAGGTTSTTFQNSSGSNNYSTYGGSGGIDATDGNGGSGGVSGWSGGSGGNGGTYSSPAATNGSSGPQYTISGTSYYFGGCGGGGSYYQQVSSSSGGLGGGGGGGFGNLGNNGESYTTPYGTTYPAGSNVFPNTGGGGAGGNGNGSQTTSGQSGNSGIIVISFTNP